MSLAEPWPLPQGWSWSTIGELADDSSGEWGKEPGEAELDVPVVRSTETRDLVADVEAAAVRSLTAKQFEKTALRDEDILVVKSSGSAQLVGRPSIVLNLDGSKAGFSNFMLRLRAKPGVHPRLLFGYLASPAGRALFLRLNRTTSGLRNLLLDRYLRVPVPRGNPDVESELLTRLDAVEDAIAAARKTQRLLEELRLSALLSAVEAPRGS
jgi:type I restriction enzyme, S subunit